jgi:hypothetical protein
MTGLQTVFHCPYCSHGEGDLAVDLDRALELALAGKSGGRPVEVDLAEPGAPPLVVYGLDRQGTAPCPHMVGSWLGLRFGSSRRGRRRRRGRAVQLGWGCPLPPDDRIGPWLSGGGLSTAMAIRTRHPDRSPQHYRPATPYSVRQIDETFARGTAADQDERWEWCRCRGVVVAALEPEQLLEEVVDGADRLVAERAQEVDPS